MEGLRARGIERVARNPECDRLVALSAASVSPATALKILYGDQERAALRDGRSPLAIGAGRQFEARLLRDGALALVALYRDAGRLPAGEVKVLDLSTAGDGTTPEGREAVRARTRAVLVAAARGETVPRVLLKPRLTVRVGAEAHEVEPDALVWSEGEEFFRVVEIKSYPDRGGKTDPEDLRGACRQAAVGVVALRESLPGVEVPARADLVLSRREHREGSLHPMTIEGEVDSLVRLLAAFPARMAEVAGRLSEGVALDAPRALESLAKHWRPSCRDLCALATRCRKEMQASADPALLGSAAAETLAPALSVVVALDLVRGRRAPANDDERRLVERLGPALTTMKRLRDVG